MVSVDPPVLPGSWKKRYPFRTGTTSFIYPAGYAENVARLGPHLDEIELLMFESRPCSRPTDRLVQDLLRLGEFHRISYNVHLPTDLPLTDPDRSVRRRAARVVQGFLTILESLNPTVYVLHLPPPEGLCEGAGLRNWQAIAADALKPMLDAGVPGRRLALENLFFPYDWLTPLLDTFDLGVCLDTGHLALQKGDLEGFLKTYAHRIVIAHLHGLQAGRDHGPLSGLPAGYRALLGDWLSRFDGSVSLEVFGYPALEESLQCLDGMLSLSR
jgi:sugar phosphate isomerase/epimerase